MSSGCSSRRTLKHCFVSKANARCVEATWRWRNTAWTARTSITLAVCYRRNIAAATVDGVLTVSSFTCCSNGAEWMRLRGVFQKGLSSPAAVQIFLNSCDDIVAEWLQRVDRLTLETNVDYLPELSRLFLECMNVFINLFSCIEMRVRL